MKKYLIYSIIIYIILFSFLIHKKYNLCYDRNSNQLKSWNYFCSKFNNFNSLDEFISLPFFVILISIFSYLLSSKIN